ncbi:spermidine/putrescine ABC transporter [Pelagivirga sediminicola]|uniref:Spermidine/putrescine import ATP-binding protein PotA n=1 Tax=Pelagivirga sediminicola TaxID=2170575 RepID=A0A2T7GBF4_9RHOB|nr:ABC transporter ATP-binding protein [Pelagivirga sediminicola]PVA11760.1 spermidine/putrescine ABC transporter [Pelagivirga sediminicola]
MKDFATKAKGAAIDIKGVSKHYGRFKALDDVDLQIQPGEFMSFLGPSGSGKTTTLNLIAGFTDLTRGEIRLDERSIGNTPAHKRNIGVVFQHYALFPHMTVAKNVAYPLQQRRVPKPAREAAVRETLAKVQLQDFAHRYPSELSGGQQQRVALARAMVFDPSVLLMDEPLGALDKKLREFLQLEIKRIHRELGSTFVYVTHDQEEALVLSDRIAVFNKGKIEQVGTGMELYTKPRTLFVGQFIGESSVLRGAHVEDGGAAVFTINGTPVRAARPAAGEGAHVILLRPETVSVHGAASDAPEGANRLTGTVTEALYLGSGVKYEVTIPGGTVISARMANAERLLTIGEEATVAWQPQDSILLADDGSAAQM